MPPLEHTGARRLSAAPAVAPTRAARSAAHRPPSTFAAASPSALMPDSARPDVLVSTDWVSRHLAESADGPPRRVQRGRAALRDRPPPQRRPRRLADGPAGPRRPRLHQPQAVRGALLAARHHARDDRRLLRRQVQLVGDLRLLDVHDVRPPRLPHHGRRAGQVDRRGPRAHARRPALREHRVHRRRAGPRRSAPSSPRSSRT